jgi:hypothetical protein
MLQTTFRSSSLNVLAQLICAKGAEVIVYDPRRLLIHDESSSFSLEETCSGLLRRMGATDPANTGLFNLSEDELVIPTPGWLIEFDGGYTYPGMESLALSFVNNKDGSPRWIYPSNLRKPRFLTFYNFNSWKASLYKFLVKTAFVLQMPTLVRNGRFVVHYKQALYVETLLKPSTFSSRDYAVLTGTTGPNRKAVVAEGQGNRVGSFLKIALNNSSAKNIENEYKSLCLLGLIPFKSTVIPKVWKINEQVIRVSNEKPTTVRKQPEFGQSHCRFLWDLYDASFERQYYRQMEITRETRERLLRLSSNPKLPENGGARDLFHKLQNLEEQLQVTNPMVATSVCHGDFTPRTVRTNGGRLFVCDWELSGHMMPVLFDLFHYVIQEKAFAGNGAVKGLRARLDVLLDSPIPAWFLRERGLDPSLYLRLYLLHHSARYLENYLTHGLLHRNGYQLFSVWSDLLGKVATQPSDLSDPVPNCKPVFPEAKIIRFEDFGLFSQSPHLINSSGRNGSL